jgi:signal transduction histidine kinase
VDPGPLDDESAMERDRVAIAARRLDALQALATGLAGALTTDQITELLMARGIAALRADGAAVFLIEPGAQELTAIGWSGHSHERAGRLSRLPLTARVPATDVARTGEPVFIEDPAAYLEQYGAAFAELGVPAEPHSIAAVPLEVDGRAFGVLGFTWNARHALPPDRQAFIAALARLGASAMERGRLFDAERAALRQAEATQRRLNLIGEAGRVLAMSLDFDVIIDRLASLGLPDMGDACVVLIPDDSRPRHVAVADPGLASVASALERGRLDPTPDGPVARVLGGGPSVAFPVDGSAPAVAGSGLRWGLAVPIGVHERTIGAMVFLRRDDRPYDADETIVADALGDRAGRALDNARLHRELGHLAERERHHAAELDAAIAALGEGILVANSDGTIRLSNDAAGRLLGGPVANVEELLGRLLRTDSRRPPALDPGPEEYRLVDRPTAWLEITAYQAAGTTGVPSPSTVIVVRDVTAFRQGQALREAFLGLLSHELRTPVTTIYGGAAVLAKPGNTLDSSMTNEILADIATESDRLYRLVEDLLVLARFDEGFELGEEPVLLQHLVPAVVEQEHGRWPGVAFGLQVENDLPAVSGDETSITQVLRNLLSNAAKYGGPDAMVTAVVEPDRDGVAVRVRDRGPGIDPREAEAIFDPFFRSPRTAKMAGGAGIGLYVSRRLVGAMNGRMWAAPGPAGGSEFSFVLPRYRADDEG